jgi:anti-anti-sigma factor
MNGVPVLRPRGEIDVAAVMRLRPTWLALADTGRPVVVVDLCDVTFIDVAGVGLLVALRNRQRAHGGRVHLRRVPAQVTRVLQLTGLASALPVEPAPPPRAPSDVRAPTDVRAPSDVRAPTDVIDLRVLEGQKQVRDPAAHD